MAKDGEKGGKGNGGKGAEQTGEQQQTPPAGDETQTGTGTGDGNDAGSTDGTGTGDGEQTGTGDEPDPSADKGKGQEKKAEKESKAGGKKGQTATPPAPAPTTSQEAELVARYQAAEAAVKLAKDTVVTAEHELTEAGKALGAFLTPPGAKRNEKVVVWIGTGDARQCIEIIKGKDDKYTIRPYGSGGPDQVRVPS